MLISNGSGTEGLRRLWLWTKQQIVQTVPDEDARCEFDCGKNHCSVGEWTRCENRLQSVRLSRAKT
jgi:hypothetical protein